MSRDKYADALYDMQHIGVSIFDAAKDYRVSTLALRDKAVDAGVDVPPLRGKGEIDVNDLRRKAAAGMTRAEMADALYTSRKNVGRLCEENGIETRDGRRTVKTQQPKRENGQYLTPGEFGDWHEAEVPTPGGGYRSPWNGLVTEFVRSGKRSVAREFGDVRDAAKAVNNIAAAAKRLKLPVSACHRKTTTYMVRTDAPEASARKA